jgi:hypothetical protein
VDDEPVTGEFRSSSARSLRTPTFGKAFTPYATNAFGAAARYARAASTIVCSSYTRSGVP